MKNERDYGIDLMRIVCALMVVVHHVSAASGLLASSHWNEFFRLVPDAFAVCAVNGFALISGYVGVGRRWKPANWAVLWVDGVFYNFVLLALESRYQGNVIGKADIVRQFLPVTMTSFWYLTMYTGVFVLMPLMNHLLETMPRRRLAGTLLAMLALFSAWSSFAGKIGMFSLLGGFSTGWLAILYLVGGYIRRYDVAARVSAKKGAALYVGAAVFNLLLRFGHTYLAEHFALVHLWESTILQGTMDWMDWYISPLTFLEALGLLLLFANLHPSAQLLPYIKWAAPLVFGGFSVEPEQVTALMGQIRESFDYCLVDAPAGLGQGFRMATQEADHVMVVTTTDVTALRDAQRTVMELDRFPNGKVHLIVNRVAKKLLRQLHTTIDDAMDAAGLPLLGVVPEDADIPKCLNQGIPLRDDNFYAARAYYNIAKRIAGYKAPLMKL